MLSLVTQVVENMVLWWEFDIIIGKHYLARISCSHPCDQNRKFCFMADTAHSLKNLRNHLTRGHSIFLPADMVENHKMLSNEANPAGGNWLSSCIKHHTSSHPFWIQGIMKKWKRGPSFSSLNHDTEAALRFLVQRGDVPQAALTIAWFKEMICGNRSQTV